MNVQTKVELVPCPCCGAQEFTVWAQERGFNLVRCADCALLYVNPRPASDVIDDGVRLGHHEIDGEKIDVRSRRIDAKVQGYQRLLSKIFPREQLASRPVVWIDYGAGYGEFISAVKNIAADGSEIIGIEPMEHKAAAAKASGLEVINAYPERGTHQADYISMINIFSHIPDFKDMLAIASSNLKPQGELIIETGNVGDLSTRDEFFNILDLPDHLVFSGEAQMTRFLNDAGFEVVHVHSFQVDGFATFAKNIVKKALGRPVKLALPYQSAYRQLIFRARRKSA